VKAPADRARIQGDQGFGALHGNGHMMMLEKNNLDVAGVMANWLAKTVADDPKHTHH
jgi:hypothetical protein